MAVRKKGVIINIASMAAFRPITRVVGYSAAKAAVAILQSGSPWRWRRNFGEGIPC